MTATNNPGRRPKKRNSDKVDLRLLIAAASLIATVGGVGWIAAEDPTPALSSQALTPATQAASGATTEQPAQPAQPTPTTVPDPIGPIEAPGTGTVAAAPTATPEPLPQVTIPQRQWPVPMGRSRSSR